MIGLHGLKDLLQSRQFCDSVFTFGCGSPDREEEYAFAAIL